MEVLKHGNQKSLNKPSKSKKERSSGRVLVDDLWIVDNISKFVCLFVYWASVFTVSLHAYNIYSKRTSRKEFRKNTWR